MATQSWIVSTAQRYLNKTSSIVHGEITVTESFTLKTMSGQSTATVEMSTVGSVVLNMTTVLSEQREDTTVYIVPTSAQSPDNDNNYTTWHDLYANNSDQDVNNTSSWDVHPLAILWLPLALCSLLIIAMGILLNGVTLLMFFRHKLSTNGSNNLVLNLTCCDLVASCVCFPFFLAALVFNRWPFGETGCKWYLITFLALGNASNNSMTAIALDR